MVSRSACVFLLLAGSSALVIEQRPISKVITLLKDMVGQIQKEAEDDQAVKAEMDCWCETGLKDKTMAISNAEKKIATLGGEIGSMAGESAKLNTEIENLNKEVAHNTEALSEQTTMRQKRLAEFTEDEKSTIGSISQMDGAITTISGKHEGSFDKASEFARTGSRSAFLQGSSQSPSAHDNDVIQAIVAVQTQLRRRPSSFTSRQREVVAAFIASPDDMGFTQEAALLQQKTGYNPGHSSKSGPIMGVLKGMKESFETNLAGSQRDETRDQADYEALKKAKDSEIAAGTNLAETKTGTLADVDQRHAESEQDLKDTQRTLAADSDYLSKLKEMCANVDAEFFERTQTRQLEQQAVSKALAFLNSDDANDLYSRTFKSAASASASFIQKLSESSKRVAGSRHLAAMATKFHDSRISTLALKIMNSIPADQAGAFESKKEETFDQIKQSIQDMIDKLVTEKEDAVKHKDFCIDELESNERNTDSQRRFKADAEAKIAELEDHIKQLTSDETALKAEIAASRVATKRAGEDRERENTQFQKTVADQRATQKLLVGALDMLKGFYEKAFPALVQAKTAQPAGAPPPQGFKKRENKSGGVMGMMQQIIDDAKAMEAEAIKGEEASMTSYETLITETNTAIVTMQKQIANIQQDRALAQSEKSQTHIDLKNANGELEELGLANTDLHSACDYDLKNFNPKQDARDAEIRGLKESVAVFSGGSFIQFVHA